MNIIVIDRFNVLNKILKINILTNYIKYVRERERENSFML